jgi:hypothetical protein
MTESDRAARDLDRSRDCTPHPPRSLRLARHPLPASGEREPYRATIGCGLVRRRFTISRLSAPR